MPKVQICLTVDWEGEHFKNLHELKKIRQLIGENIPVSHFICPAYYFRNLKNVTERIKEVVLENDEVHLHVHCYKELVEAAGVKFKTEHNYYKVSKNNISKLISKNPSGRGVPISVYTLEEQEKIIQFSRSKLQDEFPNHQISGFRAGGNILNDDTFLVLEKLGFAIDSSATAPEIYSKGYSKEKQGTLKDDYGYNAGLFSEYILALWGGSLQKEPFLKNESYFNACNGEPQTYYSQPFTLGNLIEIPENCGTTDFVSPEKTAIPVLKRLIQIANETQKDQYFQFGCHNEGEANYKMQLLEFINMAQKISKEIMFSSMHTVYNELKI